MGMKGLHFKVEDFIGVTAFNLNGSAKTKLSILSLFLYCGEFVKILIA